MSLKIDSRGAPFHDCTSAKLRAHSLRDQRSPIPVRPDHYGFFLPLRAESLVENDVFGQAVSPSANR
ncbi:protein of unknown function [Caballeronia sp. S22]